MLEGLRGEGYNFADIISVAREKWEKAFIDGAKEALVEETDWSYDDEFGLLQTEMKSVADQCRKDETKKMVNAIEVS
jgi:protein SEY1